MKPNESSHLFQILRSTQDNRFYDMLGALLPKLRSRATVSDLQFAVSACRLLCRCKTYDEELVNTSIDRMTDNVNSVRFKDMEWMCHTISYFYVTAKSANGKKLLNQICRHLADCDRSSYPAKFQSSIIRCANYLMLAGVYNRTLLSWALSPSTLKAVYGSVDQYDSHVLQLDMFAKINLAGKYGGNSLSSAEVAAMSKKNLSDEVSDDMQEVKQILDAAGAPTLVIHALPQYEVPGQYFVFQANRGVIVGRLIPF